MQKRVSFRANLLWKGCMGRLLCKTLRALWKHCCGQDKGMGFGQLSLETMLSFLCSPHHWNLTISMGELTGTSRNLLSCFLEKHVHFLSSTAVPGLTYNNFGLIVYFHSHLSCLLLKDILEVCYLGQLPLAYSILYLLDSCETKGKTMWQNILKSKRQ